MARYGIVVLLAVSLLTAPLAAQSKLPVAIDQRVRLWTAAAVFARTTTRFVNS